jgi:integrase
MIRRRRSPDGLPFRVYMRKGVRTISFYYKHPAGPEEPLARARVGNPQAIMRARRTAIKRAVEICGGMEHESTFAALVESYFAWQAALPAKSERKKADSTMEGNRREAKLLIKRFGTLVPEVIRPTDVYKYQEWRELGGAGLAANKEISLMSAILEYGRRNGRVTENVARGIKRIPSRPRTRRVEFAEVELVVAHAYTLGPAFQILALAAKTAWLTLRRPPEILSLARPAILDEGIRFSATKRKAGEPERTVTIEWSDELRRTIDEALEIKRGKVTGALLVFGNLSGQQYTKSGWGAMWRRLMNSVLEKHSSFQRFTLQDCRPGGVTSKRERGDTDTVDATLHRDSRMVDRVYDRRRHRTAKPAR